MFEVLPGADVAIFFLRETSPHNIVCTSVKTSVRFNEEDRMFADADGLGPIAQKHEDRGYILFRYEDTHIFAVPGWQVNIT